MDYPAYRPQGFRGRGDPHLPQIVRSLRRTLAKTQHGFAHDALRLSPGALGELAGILVDFAEDLHNDTRIWKAYERYNTGFFGTALPLTSEEDGAPGTSFHPDRFCHLLWIVYPTFIDGLTISPTHHDLRRIADASATFLSDAFATIPKDSGVKAFLGTPNIHGWDVKRKLVWLGSRSFLFRALFARYMAEQPPGGSKIGHTDDFVCQECTPWAGLGAIDILAGVLDISEDDRKDLRSWYERHAACFKILSVSDGTLQALNVINDSRTASGSTWSRIRSGAGNSSSEAWFRGIRSGTGRASNGSWATPPRSMSMT